MVSRISKDFLPINLLTEHLATHLFNEHALIAVVENVSDTNIGKVVCCHQKCYSLIDTHTL